MLNTVCPGMLVHDADILKTTAKPQQNQRLKWSEHECSKCSRAESTGYSKLRCTSDLRFHSMPQQHLSPDLHVYNSMQLVSSGPKRTRTLFGRHFTVVDAVDADDAADDDDDACHTCDYQCPWPKTPKGLV